MTTPGTLRPALLLLCSLLLTASPRAHGDDGLPRVDLSGGPGFPLAAHLESEALASGELTAGQLRDAGDQLFHSVYNGLDGIGMSRLPSGANIHRFTILPPGGGHPLAVSAQSCGGCHNTPAKAAAGFSETNRGLDLGRDGVGPVSPRSTTSLFGNGFLQLLAQEMTEELQRLRDEAAARAVDSPGSVIRQELTSKGIAFGSLTTIADSQGTVIFDLAGLDGVDPDLVVRPLGWKGNFTTARVVTIGAANNLMGLQSEELVLKKGGGDPLADADGDGVSRELSVGDVTAMVVYGTTRETPQPLARLVELGEVAAPEPETARRIARGETVFSRLGCTSCHVPALHLRNTVFEEPTSRGNGHYYDKLLAAADPGYDPLRPVRFDLMVTAEAPRAEAHPHGGAILRLYGDLKRHRMGRHLADPGPQPPVTAEFAPLEKDGKRVLIDPHEFLTAELWGVGNTGPWMHDARAGTLHEAIAVHGEDAPPPPGDPGRSEAQEARDAYLALPTREQEEVVLFLRSLRTYSRDSLDG